MPNFRPDFKTITFHTADVAEGAPEVTFRQGRLRAADPRGKTSIQRDLTLEAGVALEA